MTSAVEARGYIDKMVAKESKGWGDTVPALQRIEKVYGLPFWTINHIRLGRAKTVEGGMLRRIKSAYYEMCARQIRNLQHELEIDEEASGADHSDLLAEVHSLAAKAAEARKALK